MPCSGVDLPLGFDATREYERSMPRDKGAFSDVSAALSLTQSTKGQKQRDDQTDEADGANYSLPQRPSSRFFSRVGHAQLGAYVGLLVVLRFVATWLIFSGADAMLSGRRLWGAGLLLGGLVVLAVAGAVIGTVSPIPQNDNGQQKGYSSSSPSV